MDKTYDLIIIGAGPAGITSAIYSARNELDSIILTGDIGGQTAWTDDIENYTGYQVISGLDLSSQFQEHIKKYGINVREEEEVTDLRKTGDEIRVKTGKAEYYARSVIIASGKRPKELAVPGEKEFRNKGLAYCATCEGPLFAGKDVAVIGGGNSALDAALQLIKIAAKVYVVNISDDLAGDAIMVRKMRESDKTEIMNSSRVLSVSGGKLVEEMQVLTQGKEKSISVQGVFVEIGLLPNSVFAGDIDKNDVGEIKVNSRNETNVPGIFAAGDVTDVPEKQIIVSAGEGAKAALSAFKYLARN